MSRSGQSTPRLGTVAAWWYDNHRDTEGHPPFAFRYIGTGEPFCFRCGWLAPVEDGLGWPGWTASTPWLERAHLADWSALRDAGRLDEDGPRNIVPLCPWCHRVDMPEFGADDREAALAWVSAGVTESVARVVELRQMISDGLDERGLLPKGGSARGKSLMLKVDRIALQALAASTN